MQNDDHERGDARPLGTGLKRRRFLGIAGLAVGAAAAVPLLRSRTGESGGAGAGWSLPDFSQTPPFSFTYGGIASRELLPQWQHERTSSSFAHGREHVDTWTDPVSNLRVALTSKQHRESGVVSWVVRFHNDATTQSPQIADILALDLTHTVTSLRPWVVHTNSGSDSKDADFTPLELPLPDQAFRLFSTANGRPTDGITDAVVSIPWAHRKGEVAADFIDSDLHSTTVAGATAQMSFAGTSITWIGGQNVDLGQADVLIDGEEVGVVDLYAASRLTQAELFTRDDLAEGNHTILVRARGEKNPASTGAGINVDAFRVGTGDGAEIINDADERISYGGNEADQPTFIRNGWPYFNITWGGEGLILAIGWPGQWALQAERDGDDLHLSAGMTHLDTLVNGARIQQAQLADLWLEPGEEIRTPQIVAMPWKGADRHDGQNAWRRWFVDEHMPRLDGDPVPPLCPTQSNDYFPGQWDVAQDQFTFLDAYEENEATPSTGGTHDHWWIDAGWYGIPEGAEENWNWPGTWTPDPVRYPDGLKPILDRARELDMRTIVWFEPERVRTGTWLHVNHPEWLLNIRGGSDNYLLDFGNAEARAWATTTIGDMIVADGIDVYREDFNIGPLPIWRDNDPRERRGLTQIRYVEGHLQYWKDLMERSPGLVVDTCASGGRRLDVETLGLSVNFLRSDRVLDATANQTHIHGLSSWVPLHGGAVRVTGHRHDVYNARSCYGPSMHHALDPRDPKAPWDTLRTTAAEWKELSEHFYGDYYPLSAGGARGDARIAWQFGERDGSAGFVQVFRRQSNGQSSSAVKLRGLIGDKRYTVTDRDSGESYTARGDELMSTGIDVMIDSAPGSRVLQYRRA